MADKRESAWFRGAKKKAARAILQNKIRRAEMKLDEATRKLSQGFRLREIQGGAGMQMSAPLVPPRSDPYRASANRPMPAPPGPPVPQGYARAAANRPLGPVPSHSSQPLPGRQIPQGVGGWPGMNAPMAGYSGGPQHPAQRAMPLPPHITNPRTPYDPEPIPNIPGGGYSIPVPWRR